MPNQVDDVLLHAMDEPELSRVRPYSTNCEYCQLFRHIQYNRTASFLAMATLAILFCRRIIRCIYRRRQREQAYRTKAPKPVVGLPILPTQKDVIAYLPGDGWRPPATRTGVWCDS